ncbi:MAG: HlyD family type I secretion periplasmic adaptor subunit [Pseudomonadota bacterium]
MKSGHYENLDASGHLPELHEGRYARALIGTVLTAMTCLFIWAAITPVNEITTGSGVIKTQAKPEHVEHPDGGIVAAIHVESGARVAVDALLLSFDTSSLQREMSRLQASLTARQAELGRITYVLEGKGKVPDFVELNELSPKELLFWAEQTFLQSQLDLIDAESRALAPGIENLSKQFQNIADELAILRERILRSRIAVQSGAVSRNAVEDLDREFLQLERSSLGLRREILLQKSELEAKALRKSELLAERSREAALRRTEIQEQITATELTIEEIAARVERAQVRATVAGTIMDLTVSNPQEFVAPGELIAEIIPNQNMLEAEIEVSADRIGSVKYGMEARLKVLSYDFTRYGEIVGNVASISPFSYLDEAGNTVFRVTIRLPNGGQSPQLGNRPVLPGMTVTADILSDSKRVLTYLLKPLRALGDRAFTEA